jgi:hypothetical protein
MKKTTKKKASPPAARSPQIKRDEVFKVSSKMVQESFPYLELRIACAVDETSIEGVFERVRQEVIRQKPKKILVDLREGSVVLTISDLLSLAKKVIRDFSGSIERWAVVLQSKDLMKEKFFEPSVTTRGLPTLVTSDIDEAIYWLGTKLRSGL